MTSTQLLRSRVRLTSQARFCRPAEWVTAPLSLTQPQKGSLHNLDLPNFDAKPHTEESLMFCPTILIKDKFSALLDLTMK